MTLQDYEDIPAPTNREDRAKRINPLLNCAICPPNRGENQRHERKRMAAGGPREKARTKDIARARREKEQSR